MENGAVVFCKMWKKHLEDGHFQKNTKSHALSEHEQEVALIKASDLRACDLNKANILWLEQV